MALFGGSKTTTRQISTQVGADNGSFSIGGGRDVDYHDESSYIYTNEFPETVGKFAQRALDLAGQAIDASQSLADKSVGASAGAISTLGGVAAREKTPLTEWIPFAVAGATALVMIFWIYRS